jgi:hypothetical protein
MLCLIELEGADWVEGPDHTVQHAHTPPPLDIELVQERESVEKDLPQPAIPQAPNRGSSRLSLMLQKPTMDTATLSKKGVSSSSRPSKGLFKYTVNRYYLPRLV